MFLTYLNFWILQGRLHNLLIESWNLREFDLIWFSQYLNLVWSIWFENLFTANKTGSLERFTCLGSHWSFSVWSCLIIEMKQSLKIFATDFSSVINLFLSHNNIFSFIGFLLEKFGPTVFIVCDILYNQIAKRLLHPYFIYADYMWRHVWTICKSIIFT